MLQFQQKTSSLTQESSAEILRFILHRKRGTLIAIMAPSVPKIYETIKSMELCQLISTC